MTTLFHSAPIPLGEGSIILPGNWGRILRHFGERHSSWQREIVLERVRQQYYPEKPSRFACCFACPGETELRAYAWCLGRDPNSIPAIFYEVEALGPQAVTHTTDWNAVEPRNGSGDDPEANAHLYWTASRWYSIAEMPGVRCAEVLTSSALRVVRRFE